MHVKRGRGETAVCGALGEMTEGGCQSATFLILYARKRGNESKKNVMGQ